MNDHANDPATDGGCPYCGGTTHADVVRLALWEGDRLVVIDGVPARVCAGCFEQFFDDTVNFTIDALRGRRFPEERAERMLRVPVFAYAAEAASLTTTVERGATASEEVRADA